MRNQNGKVMRKLFLVLALLLVSGFFLFGGILFAAHMPVIVITSPGVGEEVSGTIPVAAQYSIDNGHVHSLTLFAAGDVISQVDMHLKEGAYTFNLNTSNYNAGPLEIKVQACSANENSGHCSTDTVTVNIEGIPDDIVQPLISIESPASNEMLSSKPVLVSAELSDNVAVNAESVVVKLDGTAVTSQCSVTAVSVSCSLNPSEGTHVLTIDCKDTSDNSAAQKSVSFTIDTIAPVVAVTSHTNGQIVNTERINLAGTMSDATSGVTSVEVNGTTAAVNGGNWSMNNFVLDEGTNLISVAASDAAGNEKTFNLTITYIPIDVVAPTINIVSPEQGETIDSAPVSFFAELSDNVAVNPSSVEVRLDNANVTSQCTITAISVSCSLSPTAGAHYVTIGCKDTSNNSALEKRVNFVLGGGQNADVEIASPDEGEEISGTVPVVVDYEVDSGNIHTLVLYAGGREVGRIDVHKRTGVYSFNLNTKGFPNGPLEIKVEARVDGHGGGTVSDSVHVNIDNTRPDRERPRIEIESPAPGEIFEETPISVAAELSDNAAVDPSSVAVRLDGTNVTSQCVVTDISVSCVLSPDEGPHNLTIDCKDTSGNSADQKSVHFMVGDAGSHSPVVEIESPEAGEEVSGIIPIIVNYSVEGGHVHSLTLYVNGHEARQEKLQKKSGVHTFYIDTAAYNDGPITIKVEADTRGHHHNTSSDSVTIIVNNIHADREPPVIDIESPSPGEIIDTLPMLVEAELSDNVAVNPATVIVKLDGANVTSQCTVTALSVNCLLNPNDGHHRVTIDCKDTSNNRAAGKSVNFKVDTASASDRELEITSPEDGDEVSGTIPVIVTYSVRNRSVRELVLYAGGQVVARANVHKKQGVYTFSLNTTSYSEGQLEIKVEARLTGHRGRNTLSDRIKVIVNNGGGDTEAPVINIESPTPGELFNAVPVTVEAELSDNVAVNPATVVVKLDGTDVTSQCLVTAVSVNCPLSPADGQHNVTIDCKDTSNNSAAQKSVNFTIDMTAPSVAVTSHTDGQEVNAATINLAGTVSDATSGVVSVEVNGNAAAIAGGVWTYNNLSLDEGANAIAIVAEDAAGNTKTIVLNISYVKITCSSNTDCDDAEPLTLDTCVNPGTGASYCVNTVIECNTNTDCDDGDTHTEDVCANGGTVSAACSHNQIACFNDSECNDNNMLTLDKCNNPGAANAFCSNDPLACNTDTDCDDTNPLTIDTCSNGGTAQAACVHTLIQCIDDTDCADSNPLTLDSCSNGGTVQSICSHVQIACISDADCGVNQFCIGGGTTSALCTACRNNADCDDSNDHTNDICNNANTSTASCSHDTIRCLNDSECDDNDSLTIDSCENPGTVQSTCTNTQFACNSAADCDDGNTLTIDGCENPGTLQSSCTHTSITCNSDEDCAVDQFCIGGGTVSSVCTACRNNSDCNDNDDHTEDICTNANTASAVCEHNEIRCFGDSECNDDNPLTIDQCENPGTVQSTCTNTQFACNSAANCDDGDALTIDECIDPGTLQSSCTHTQITCNNNTDCAPPAEFCINGGTTNALCAACRNNSDCDDGDSHTEDVCNDGSTASATCTHNAIMCLNDEECDDSVPLTLDVCENPGTVQSTCTNTAFVCNTDANCDDGIALTIDKCVDPGTLQSSCTHIQIACNTDTDCTSPGRFCVDGGTTTAICSACLSSADCNDGNDHTEDTCINEGTASAACTNIAIACLNNTECDDSNPWTLDACNNPGTINSSCSNDPMQCIADTDCADTNPLTIDTCINVGTTSATCQHTLIACNTADDCDDQNPLTIDTCSDGGTTSSACAHTQIACNSDADCAAQGGFCVNGGTTSALCSLCRNNDDCDDGNAHTEDICSNESTAAAACSHNTIRCLNDGECNDGIPLTLDICENPGTVQSTCTNTAFVCNSAANCDDSNPLTLDTCENPGTLQSECAHTLIACNIDADCTAPAIFCVAGGTTSAVCTACRNNIDCDDDNSHTADICIDASASTAACSHENITCLNDTECDDSNPETTDTCLNPGTSQSSCNHEQCPYACTADTDCNDNNIQTTDTCVNPSTCSAQCSNIFVPLTLTLNSPADGLITNNASLTVNGIATPGVTVTVNGNAVAVASDGSFATTITLVEGANTITAEAIRGTETITKTASVTLDTQSPSVTSIEPHDGQMVGTPPAEIVVVATDNTGGSGLNVSATVITLDGENLTAVYDETTSTFRAAVSLSGSGSHTISVSTADLAGNAITRTAVFSIDVTPPAITFISHTDGQTVGENRPVITVKIEDTGFGVNWNDSSCVTTSGCTLVQTSGDNGQITFINPLHEGENIINIHAVDLSPTPNAAEATIRINVNSTPPAISGLAVTPNLISPNNEGSAGVKDSAHITASISDSDGYTWKVEIRNNSEAVKTYTGEDSAVDLIWDGTDESGDPLPDGVYSIVLSAMDKSQFNHYAEAITEVTIDNTSPTVDIESPLDGENIQGTSFPAVIDATDSSTVEAVKIYIDGEFSAEAALDTGTTWRTEIDAQSLSSGNHTIGAVAIDAAGNPSATQTHQFVLNMMPPATTINSPDAGSWQKTNFTINVTNADASGSGLNVCYYRVLSNGTQTLGWTAYGCSTNPSITVGADTSNNCRNEGLNTCQVDFYDINNAGSSSPIISRQFSIDWSVPTAAIVAPIAGSIIGGTSAAVTVRAIDSAGPERVDLYIEDALFASSSVDTGNGIFKFAYNPQTVSAGSHTFNAIAFDKAGTPSASASVQITISHEMPFINSVYPQRGGFGDAVTILGSGLCANPNENIVRFGGVQAEVISGDSFMVTARVPAPEPGSVSMTKESGGNVSTTAGALSGPVTIQCGASTGNSFPFELTDQSGEASVVIPAGALPEDAVITVRRMLPKDNPANIPGGYAFGGGAFFTKSMVFNSPVTITLTLEQELTPGQELPMFFLDSEEDNQKWTATDIKGTVTSDGKHLTAQVPKFSAWVSGIPPRFTTYVCGDPGDVIMVIGEGFDMDHPDNNLFTFPGSATPEKGINAKTFRDLQYVTVRVPDTATSGNLEATVNGVPLTNAVPFTIGSGNDYPTPLIYATLSGISSSGFFSVAAVPTTIGDIYAADTKNIYHITNPSTKTLVSTLPASRRRMLMDMDIPLSHPERLYLTSAPDFTSIPKYDDAFLAAGGDAPIYYVQNTSSFPSEPQPLYELPPITITTSTDVPIPWISQGVSVAPDSSPASIVGDLFTMDYAMPQIAPFNIGRVDINQSTGESVGVGQGFTNFNPGTFFVTDIAFSNNGNSLYGAIFSHTVTDDSELPCIMDNTTVGCGTIEKIDTTSSALSCIISDISTPTGIAVGPESSSDSVVKGNLFISSMGESSVYKAQLDPATGNAVGGWARYSCGVPAANRISFDHAGNAYITSSNPHANSGNIFKLLAPSQSITPSITSIGYPTQCPRDNIHIFGNNFLAAQGASYVAYRDGTDYIPITSEYIVNWSDTDIELKLPPALLSMTTKEIKVRVENQFSNAVVVNIDVPQITSITPAELYITDSTGVFNEVTISGTNFTSGSNDFISFPSVTPPNQFKYEKITPTDSRVNAWTSTEIRIKLFGSIFPAATPGATSGDISFCDDITPTHIDVKPVISIVSTFTPTIGKTCSISDTHEYAGTNYMFQVIGQAFTNGFDSISYENPVLYFGSYSAHDSSYDPDYSPGYAYNSISGLVPGIGYGLVPNIPYGRYEVKLSKDGFDSINTPADPILFEIFGVKPTDYAKTSPGIYNLIFNTSRADTKPIKINLNGADYNLTADSSSNATIPGVSIINGVNTYTASSDTECNGSVTGTFDPRPSIGSCTFTPSSANPGDSVTLNCVNAQDPFSKNLAVSFTDSDGIFTPSGTISLDSIGGNAFQKTLTLVKPLTAGSRTITINAINTEDIPAIPVTATLAINNVAPVFSLCTLNPDNGDPGASINADCYVDDDNGNSDVTEVRIISADNIFNTGASNNLTHGTDNHWYFTGMIVKAVKGKPYNITFSATDSKPTTVNSSAITFTVNNLPPVITTGSCGFGTTNANPGQFVVLTCNMTDPNGTSDITSANFVDTEGVFSTAGSTIPLSLISGTTWKTATLTIKNVTGKSYNFTVNASDGLLSDTEPASININNVPPTISCSNFSPVQGIPETTLVDLTCTVTDANGDTISTVYISKDNGVFTPPIAGADIQLNNTSVSTWSVTGLQIARTPHDAKTIAIYATDITSAINSTSKTFTVQNGPPDPPVCNFSSLSGIKGDVISVNCEADDKNTAADITRVYINDALGIFEHTGTQLDLTKSVDKWVNSTITVKILTAGEYAFSVVSSDGAFTNSSNYTFRTNNILPVFDTCTFTPNSALPGANINISCHVTDTDGGLTSAGSSVSIDATSVPFNSVTLTRTAASTNYSAYYTGTIAVKGVPAATYTVNFTAIDKDGGADHKGYTFTVINSSPVIGTCSPVTGDIHQQVTISCQISDINNDTLTVTLDDSANDIFAETNPITLNPDGLGNYTASVTVNEKQGDFTYIVNAIDIPGNQIAKQMQFKVDMCPGYSVTSNSDEQFAKYSLRMCIAKAGIASTPQTVTFNLPPASTFIEVASPITISGSTGMTIDGSISGSAGVIVRKKSGSCATGCDGIVLSSNGNTLKNLKISGFDYTGKAGIAVTGNNNTVIGNWIGTENGTDATPNYYGIALSGTAQNNTIGNNTANGVNAIVFNASHGVTIGSGASRAKINYNQIYGNGGLGIKLESGANGGIAAPAIRSLMNSATSGYLKALVNVPVCAAAPCTVEIYETGENSILEDPSGAGEGYKILISSQCSGTGNCVIDNIPIPNSTTKSITATVTDSTGNTSQFANNYGTNNCTVTSNADTGDWTLRSCIDTANTSAGTKIVFDPSVTQVNIQTALPYLTGDRTEIEGNTSGGDPATKIVGLGPDSSTTFYGLNIQSKDVKLSHLIILGFKVGLSTFGDTADNAIIEDNWIGTADGTSLPATALRVGNGIINGTNHSTTHDSANIIRRNVISGSTNVNLTLYNCAACTIADNMIGVNAAGTALLDATGSNACIYARGINTRDTISGNVIGGCTYGIYFESTSQSTISNNFIGISQAGADIHNKKGIFIYAQSSDNTISNNTIAYNDDDAGYGGGIYVYPNNNHTRITQNRIYENTGAGIVFGAYIPSPNDDIKPPVIDNIVKSGGNYTISYTIPENSRCTSAQTCTAELFLVDNTSSPTVSPDESKTGEAFRYVDHSLNLQCPAAPATCVLTFSVSEASLPTTSTAITMTLTDSEGNTSTFAQNHLIDDDCEVTSSADTGSGTLRSCIDMANTFPGTKIVFDPSVTQVNIQTALPYLTGDRTEIEGNTSGGDPATKIVGLGPDSSTTFYGLNIQSKDVKLSHLIILGFKVGLSTFGDTADNAIIEDNWIGTADGTSLPATALRVGNGIINGTNHSTTHDSANIIRRNVISGSTNVNLTLYNCAACTIADNMIGVNAAGTALLDATGSNACIYARGINTRDTISGNVIGGCTYGIYFESTSQSTISNNFIGISPAGADIHNKRGLFIYSQSSDNTISNNSIAYNNDATGFGGGIYVSANNNHNTFTKNRIYENTGAGIVFEAYNPSPNDGIQPPVIQTIFDNGNGLYTINVHFPDGIDCTSGSNGCKVELFIADGPHESPKILADSTGYGEGFLYVNHTPESELTSFCSLSSNCYLVINNVNLRQVSRYSSYLTATITDSAGNTSTYAANYEIPNVCPDLMVRSSADRGSETLRSCLATKDLLDNSAISFNDYPVGEVINLKTTLPSFTKSNITIDGGNKNIILDGSGITAIGGVGLNILTSNNVVKNLEFRNFPAVGIYIGNSGSTTTDNLVQNCKIHHNGSLSTAGGGISLFGSGVVRNTLSQNSIYENNGPGIKLSMSANASAPPPVIETVTKGTDGKYLIKVDIPLQDNCMNGPKGLCKVEIFAANDPTSNVVLDPTGSGEGYMYVTSYTTLSNCDSTYCYMYISSVDVSSINKYSTHITATVTDSYGNTSPYAANFALPYHCPDNKVTSSSDTTESGTLRSCMYSGSLANGNSIDFSALAVGTVISIQTALPIFDKSSITIDGGSGRNIVLDGTLYTASGGAGLRINTSSNVVKNLEIRNFPAAGIAMGNSGSTTTDNLVQSCKIHHNGALTTAGGGVTLYGAGVVRNKITQNSIYENNGPGIKLSSGANGSLSAPTIVSITKTATNYVITASVASTATCSAALPCKVEFFLADDTSIPVAADTTSGEGYKYLDYLSFTTAGVSLTKNILISSVSSTSHTLSATLTDGNGNTSPFAVNMTLP